MDWQVKSVAKQSDVTGKAFEPGDRVFSYLYKDEEGNLARADVLDEEKEGFTPPGSVLGWWGQTIKDEADEAAARRQALRTSEGLFLSLYEEGAEASEESAILKYLLAIMLERKRILKPLTQAAMGEAQRYAMVKTKEEYEVPAADITGEAVLKVEEQLRAII